VLGIKLLYRALTRACALVTHVGRALSRKRGSKGIVTLAQFASKSPRAARSAFVHGQGVRDSGQASRRAFLGSILLKLTMPPGRRGRSRFRLPEVILMIVALDQLSLPRVDISDTTREFGHLLSGVAHVDPLRRGGVFSQAHARAPFHDRPDRAR
jgi:hypothetical protein